MVDPKNDTNLAPKSHARARVFAAFALTAFVAGVGYAGREGYFAATDSFVAPIILSPESDLVLQSKAKLAELEVERSRLVSESESIDVDLVAADKAIAQLKDLSSTMSSALEWTKTITKHQAAASMQELTALARQRTVLQTMVQNQAKISEQASANLSASLISKTDQAKEDINLGQVRLALIENDRARFQQEAALNQAYFAQKSLAKLGSALMPEAIAREEQMVRIELEISRLESEQRAKRSEKKVVTTKLAKMDELESQLKGRPMFRATEKSIEVAFVPYTQIDGVTPSATVYDCTWGVVRCRPVGTITEVIPGEVILPDPWGSPARGQYAVLDLKEHASAKAKVLRVRGSDGHSAPARPTDGGHERVASVK